MIFQDHDCSMLQEACRADAATLSNGPTLDALPDISEDGAEGESPC